MKKNIYNLFCLLAVMILSLTSCGSDDPIIDDGGDIVDPEPPMENEVAFDENLLVEASGKNCVIVFSTSGVWSLSTSKSWLTIEKKNGGAGNQKIALTVEPNTDVYEDRSGYLTLVEGTNSRRMTITQSKAAKEIRWEEDTVRHTYNKYAEKIESSIKMVSNFEWKVKSYPTWMNEPNIITTDGRIPANLTDSTEIVMSLIKDSLTVKALTDSIEFVDMKDADGPVIRKLYVTFSGMGLASITWEREALQRTDPAEDLSFGVMFKAVADGTSDGIRYERDDYSNVSGFPKSAGYVDFYIKTPRDFDYTTMEEASQFFDVFALPTSTHFGHPDNNIDGSIKFELTDHWTNDKNPNYIRRYWRAYFTEDNPSCLRRHYLVYVLPKGERERLFDADGVFNVAEYETEGKMVTQRGGLIKDFSVLECTGIGTVTVDGGLFGPEEVKGVYVGKGHTAIIDIKVSDPDVLKESYLCYSNGSPIAFEKSWLQASWNIDSSDPSHLTLRLSYKNMPEDGNVLKKVKIIFQGDAYSTKELKILDTITVMQKHEE